MEPSLENLISCPVPENFRNAFAERVLREPLQTSPNGVPREWVRRLKAEVQLWDDTPFGVVWFRLPATGLVSVRGWLRDWNRMLARSQWKLMDGSDYDSIGCLLDRRRQILSLFNTCTVPPEL